MDEQLLDWLKTSVGKTFQSPREYAFGQKTLPLKLIEIDEKQKKVKIDFVGGKSLALPLFFWMFDRALEYIEANKGRCVRLGAKVQPPCDPDTIEGKIWEKPYLCSTPYKASPHVCDFLVLSGLAEYGRVKNVRTGRTVQGIRYAGLATNVNLKTQLDLTEFYKAPATTNTHAILSYLKENPRNAYCDDCLSARLNIRPRQQVNQICSKRLAPKGKILRQESECSLCLKHKQVNSVYAASRPSYRVLGKSPQEDIGHYVKAYYEKFQHDPNHRYRSWEHCYRFFRDQQPFNDESKDLANLHLAFYLASWGMYRGSSFLLWKDYKIFDLIVDVLIKPEYQRLWYKDSTCFPPEDSAVNDLFRLRGEMIKAFKKTIHTVNGEKRRISVTDTLITKILLGTLSCTPAYDYYFREGLKRKGFGHRGFTKEGYSELLRFYESNSATFEEIRIYIPETSLRYPPMKLVDMYFWTIGFESQSSLPA